jgi:hypothetical protein
MNDDLSVADAHSLTIAVADETVTAEAAYCGLSPADVHSLADRHPTLEVLVRLRSADADARTVMQVRDLAAWSTSAIKLIVQGRAWCASDIRDVAAKALEMASQARMCPW